MSNVVLKKSVWIAAATAWACAASLAMSQTPPDYGFEFRTVGAVGNGAFNGPVPPGGDYVVGRGQVNYQYRAARTEISTSQWVEFLNAFAPFSNVDVDNLGPVHWGAGTTGLLPNGHFTYSVINEPGSGNFPVGGISWRDAARYCNWLQNGKRVDPSALVTGAYDTTTFGQRPDGTITDAPTRLPGALYFIPTLDEQLKAEHYDPNRFGVGQGGWWLNKNGSDLPGTPGPPGVGTTSAGYYSLTDPNIGWRVPLGAYASSLSPWGLLDTSGGASEWDEELIASIPTSRAYFGTWAGGRNPDLALLDGIAGFGSQEPFNGSHLGVLGFRIYSAVPVPGTVFACGSIALIQLAQRRRKA